MVSACNGSRQASAPAERAPAPAGKLWLDEETATPPAPTAADYIKQCKESGISVPPGPIVTKEGTPPDGAGEELGPNWKREKDVKSVTLPGQGDKQVGRVYTYTDPKDGTYCIAFERVEPTLPDTDRRKNGFETNSIATGLICTNKKTDAACFFNWIYTKTKFLSGTLMPIESGFMDTGSAVDCLNCHVQGPLIQTPDLPKLPRVPAEGWKPVFPEYPFSQPKLPELKKTGVDGCVKSGCHAAGIAPINETSCLVTYAPVLGGAKPRMPVGGDDGSAARPIIEECCKLLGDGSTQQGSWKAAYDSLCKPQPK